MLIKIAIMALIGGLILWVMFAEKGGETDRVQESRNTTGDDLFPKGKTRKLPPPHKGLGGVKNVLNAASFEKNKHRNGRK